MRRPTWPNRLRAARSRALTTRSLALVFGALALPLVITAPGGVSGVEAQRRTVVELTEEGRIADAAEAIRVLERQHPHHAGVKVDLIRTLLLAGDTADLAARTADIDPRAVPEALHIEWARALRDAGEFAAAARVLRDSRHRLGQEAQTLFALASAEAGDAEAARMTIATLLPDTNAPDRLAELAYGLRRADAVHEAVRVAQTALDRDPHHAAAYEQFALALRDLGADSQALAAMQARPELFDDDTRWETEANLLARQVRQARMIRAEMEVEGRLDRRNLALELALERIERFLAETPSAHPQHRRAAFDRVVVLRDLERYTEAIEAFETLTAESTAPAYARRAAADAYLESRQPQTALALYQSVLPENEAPDVELLQRLYFTHLALENYAVAGDILEQARRETPVWLATGPGRDPEPNWERVDIDQLHAYDAAYRQNLALAWTRASDLVATAPANAGFHNTQARIARWRGWPERAREHTAIAETLAPNARDTRLNRAENARDLGEHVTWEREVLALVADYPDSADVQRLHEELQWRRRPSLDAEASFGRTSGDGLAVSGNRDATTRVRVNSPWFSRAQRLFIEHRYATTTFGPETAPRERIGVGLEWAARRQQAWVRVDRDLRDDANTGLAAGWSQWLDDHWRYGVAVDTASMDVPLRAHAAGITGRQISASVDWRAHESLSAYARTDWLALSDGNRRRSAGAGMTARVFAAPHHLTDVGLDAFIQRNSQPGGPYFNPEQTSSLAARIDHQWVSWRHYDRSLTQHFHASAGFTQQAGFGSDPSVTLRYEHRWNLDRRWALDYGLGWNTTVYDGDRENRLFALVRLRGIF